MAEFATAFGIVTGVIGLVPLCGKGYNFIESIVTADRHAEEQLIRIQIQRMDLDAWARVWEIPESIPLKRTESKIQRFVDKDKRLGYNMLKTFSVISNMFANQLERALPSHVSSNQDPINLETVSRVYGEEIKRRHKAGQQAQGLELIRDIAAFKARAQQLVKRRYRAHEERRRSNKEKSFLLSGDYLDVQEFDIKDNSSASGSTEVTLAISKRVRKTRYIEWKPYAYEVVKVSDDYDIKTHRQIDKKAEDDTMALSDFFNVEDRPAAFRILPFLGIFRDEERRRFGFVYEPPEYIENLEGHRIMEGQIAKLRMPRSLLQQLEMDSGLSSPIVWPLGDRFKLASTLAQCLYVLHAAGWVHKNIRSSSVIFLPHESTHGGAPSGDTTTKDITKPYLCGFGHSRPGQLPENEPAPVQRHKQQQSAGNSSFPSRSKTYWNITLDQYHHPAKRVDSSLSYTQAFDLYSLGVVLLELGLWQPLSTVESTTNLRNDPEVLREHLFKIARNELPGQVGKIYANVVIECLKVGADTSDATVQEILCWKVAAALDACTA
ncbi:MAG: hypothetical protein Q9195_002397 [Heterodermia aff. obscurata]